MASQCHQGAQHQQNSGKESGSHEAVSLEMVASALQCWADVISGTGETSPCDTVSYSRVCCAGRGGVHFRGSVLRRASASFASFTYGCSAGSAKRQTAATNW